ncbi:MAG TPA: response regulator [Armatimonadota bacterium]|nr:response regulator [Armatimonadota bacterium]
MAGTSVFVVDDDPQIPRLFSEALTRHGYSVRAATDGESALKNLKKSKPEVIFLDLKLSGTDDLQTLEGIRGLHPDVPVIIITAYPRDPLVDNAIRMGVFACLVKPLSMAHVLGILETLEIERAPEPTTIAGPVTPKI